MFTPIVADATTTAITNGCPHRLPGTVPNYPQYLEAAEAARRAAGVTRVHNHLELVLPPEDYRDDAVLIAAANNALAASATVPEGVEATASNGNLTLAGAVYITFVCLLPEFLILKYNVPFYFGGTSLLIIVVVTMDFMAQVQNYLMSQQYESLLKKANFKTSLGG